MKTIVLPYNENLVQVCKPLKNLGVRVAFKYNTIKSFLISNAPKTEAGGVYKIQCKDCESFYIGQTGKTLNKRISQHKYSVRTGQSNSALFHHAMNNDHIFDWENGKFVYKSNNYIDRSAVESAFIAATYKENVNSSYGHIRTDPFINNLITNSLP